MYVISFAAIPVFPIGLIAIIGNKTTFSVFIASHPIAGYYYRNGGCEFNDIQSYKGKSVNECAALCTANSTCVGS